MITKELESRLGSCIGADGAIFAIRKELYLPLKDYDINDFVIPLSINQQGYRGVLQREAICFEKDAGSPKGEFQRQVRITSRTIRAIMNYRRLLNPFRFGLLSFELFSHKVCRFLVPLFMVALLVSNLLLAERGGFYLLALIAQGIFYIAAGAASFVPKGNVMSRMSEAARTFVVVNAAIALAWVKVLARGDLYHLVSDETISAVATRPTMSFRLFLLCSFVLLGRPQDVLTFLQPLRPALVLTVLAMAAMVIGGRRQELSAALSMPESKRYWLFYFIMIVGVPFAYHKRVAFEGVLEAYVVNMLFFVLLVFHVTSLQRLKSLVWVICLCALMYSVFGGLLQAGNVGAGRFRLAGKMFDPNDTAYVLVSLLPLCLSVVRFANGPLKRLVAVVAILSGIAIVLQTGSRGGLVGLGAVLLILLLTKAGGIGKAHKCLIVVMLVSALLVFGDLINVERYLTLTDISSDYNVSSRGGRLELWQAAIDFSFANPLTGVGVNCYPWAHFLARAGVGDTYLQYHVVHNSFLQVSAEMGLIGFGVFTLINVRSFATFSRLSRLQVQPESSEAIEIRTLSGFMLLGFAGLLVTGFFLSQGYSIFFTLYFALAAAMTRLQAGSAASIGAMRNAADTAERYRSSRVPAS